MAKTRTFAPVTLPDGTVVKPKSQAEAIQAKQKLAQMKRESEGRKSIADTKGGPIQPSKETAPPPTDPKKVEKVGEDQKFDFASVGLDGVFSSEDPRSKALADALPDYKPPSGENVTQAEIDKYKIEYQKQALILSGKQTDRVVKGAGAEIEQAKNDEVEREAAEKGRILSKQKTNPAWKALSKEEKKAATQVYDEKLDKFVPRETPLVPQFIAENHNPAIQKQGEQGKDKKRVSSRPTTKDEQIAQEEKQRKMKDEAMKEKNREKGKINPDIKREIEETAQAQKQADALKGQLESARPDSVTVQAWNLLSDEEKTVQIELDEQIVQNAKDATDARQDIIDSYTPDPNTGKLAPQDAAAMNKKLSDFDDRREQQQKQEKNAMLQFDVAVDTRLGTEFGAGAAKNALRNKQSALFVEDNAAFEIDLKKIKKLAEDEAVGESEEFISEGARTNFMEKFAEKWDLKEAGLRADHETNQLGEQEDLEIAIANNKDLSALEKSLTSKNDVTKLKAKEKYAYVMDFVGQDSGDPATVVGRAMGAYEESIKYGTTPKDAQVYQEIDQIIKEKQLAAEQGGTPFDGTEVLQLAASKFDGNLSKGKTYMKSRGYLAGDIETQTEEYQRTVLGYTDDQVTQTKEYNTVSDIISRQALGEAVSLDELNYIADYETKDENARRAEQLRVRAENPDTEEMSDAEVFAQAELNIEEKERLEKLKGKKAKVDKGDRFKEAQKAVSQEFEPDASREDIIEYLNGNFADLTVTQMGVIAGKAKTAAEDLEKMVREDPQVERIVGLIEDGTLTEEDLFNDIEGEKVDGAEFTPTEYKKAIRVVRARKGDEVSEEDVDKTFEEAPKDRPGFFKRILNKIKGGSSKFSEMSDAEFSSVDTNALSDEELDEYIAEGEKR